MHYATFQEDLHAEFYFTKFMAIVITLLFNVVKMKDCICIIFIQYLTYLQKYPMLLKPCAV